MTALSDRLRAAAEAERLADWVRVSRGGEVYWRLQGGESGREGWDEREGEWKPLMYVQRPYPSRRDNTLNVSWWEAELPTVLVFGGGRRDGLVLRHHPTREAAIRAGLLALAEREEAR